MSARRAVAGCMTVAAIVTLTLTIASLAASATQSKRTAPTGVIADCSTRSLADFPGAFTRPRNLVVGPLVLIGGGGTPAFVPPVGGNKFPLLVKAGHRVTVELSVNTRRGAGLAYGPLPQGAVHLRDTHRIVTFIACPRSESSGSSADGQAVTFWSGGILARSPRCVPLLVWVDSATAPRHAVVRLGARRCA